MTQRNKERKIHVDGLANYYHGPTDFDELIPFGRSLEWMRGSVVPVEERIMKSHHGLRFLGFEDSQVAKIYEKITGIANRSSPDDPESRYRYQLAMAEFFSPLGSQLKDGIFVAVLRAGKFVSLFYPSMTVVEIEGKRLPMVNGEMELGLIGRLPYKSFAGQKVIIGEGCVATGLTVAGILERLSRYGVRPKSVEVHALAISQRGAEYLLERAGKLDLPLEIVGGMPVFAMNDHFYLLRVDEKGWPEGTFAVGDAGDWSLPLPKSYNDRAWWNRTVTTS